MRERREGGGRRGVGREGGREREERRGRQGQPAGCCGFVSFVVLSCVSVVVSRALCAF